MWQRIQTLFLIILILSLLVSLIFPVWSFGTGDNARVLTAFYYLEAGNYQYSPYCFTAVFAIAASTLALTEITKFKNRLTQIKLGALNSLFLVLTVGSAFYFASQFMKELEGDKGRYGLGIWLPFVAVVCNLLANRFIRRDEKLVRDSDRLR